MCVCVCVWRGEGGGGLLYKKGGDACQKISVEPLKVSLHADYYAPWPGEASIVCLEATYSDQRGCGLSWAVLPLKSANQKQRNKQLVLMNLVAVKIKCIKHFQFPDVL